MSSHQREQNPDVNSYSPDVEPGESPGVPDNPNDKSSDIEGRRDTDVIPVPPDVAPAAPVEEPPAEGKAPVGDVDDSPKQIA